MPLRLQLQSMKGQEDVAVQCWLAFPGNDHWHEDRVLPGLIDVGTMVELFN
jgi:hypothetical protein